VNEKSEGSWWYARQRFDLAALFVSMPDVAVDMKGLLSETWSLCWEALRHPCPEVLLDLFYYPTSLRADGLPALESFFMRQIHHIAQAALGLCHPFYRVFGPQLWVRWVKDAKATSTLIRVVLETSMQTHRSMNNVLYRLWDAASSALVGEAAIASWEMMVQQLMRRGQISQGQFDGMSATLVRRRCKSMRNNGLSQDTIPMIAANMEMIKYASSHLRALQQLGRGYGSLGQAKAAAWNTALAFTSANNELQPSPLWGIYLLRYLSNVMKVMEAFHEADLVDEVLYRLIDAMCVDYKVAAWPARRQSADCLPNPHRMRGLSSLSRSGSIAESRPGESWRLAGLWSEEAGVRQYVSALWANHSDIASLKDVPVRDLLANRHLMFPVIIRTIPSEELNGIWEVQICDTLE
jgi:hypothetical protein